MGATGESSPFNVTTTNFLGNRVVYNYQIYKYNYAIIGLIAGM